MTTANPQPTPAPATPPAPAPLPLLQAVARTMFVGLLWGGVLLIILAWWLGLKFAEEGRLVIPWVIGLIGAAAIGLAGWHAFVLWLQKIPPEQKAIALAGQRRITGLALLVGGAALVVIALILGFAPRPGASGTWATLRGNFGEAVGLFLFALVVLGAGRALLNPPRDAFTTVNLEPLRGFFAIIRIALFIAGAALILVFAILVFQQRVGWTYFPELAGLLLFSMLCVTLGLWLTSVPAPDSFQTRVFVLIFGGSTGLILFLMTLARAVAWRQQVFFSGMGVWQGEESWQLWLVVYLQMIALALMFGSLLLARADIRANAILRRVLFGYTTLLNALLILEMLIVLNIVFNAMWPNTYDWNQTRGLHALAPASKNLLHQLKQPTQVYVVMSARMSSQTDVRVLLDNLQVETNKLQVTFISPDRDRVEYDELAKKFPKILPSAGRAVRDQESGRGLLIVYGPVPKDEKHNVPYAFIPERKIYDEQGGMHGQKPSRTFKGEVEVMKELKYLVQGGEKRKLYFLQGDDEIDITDTDVRRRIEATGEMALLGASMLAERLKKDNYDVETVTFSKEYAEKKKADKTERIRYIGEAGADRKPELPDPKETHAVVIAGASSPLSPDALTAIERYLDRGGRLMVLFDVVLAKSPKAKDFKLRESGLEDLLKKYGIASTDEFAIAQMVPRTRAIDPFNILTKPPENSENLIAKQFASVPMYFHSVRVIRPSTAGRFKGEVVLSTIKWEERFRQIFPATVAVRQPNELLRPLETFQDLADRGELLKQITQELPVVVAVSEDTKPRLVVFGDTEFVSNYAMRTEDRANNYSLFVSALEWMSEHEGMIGLQPKSSPIVEMPPGIAMQYTRIHVVPLWLMFLSIVGLGTGIWLVRRR